MPGAGAIRKALALVCPASLRCGYGSQTASNTADRRAGARAASTAGLWQEHSPGCGARMHMARTESIPTLITSACYEPMTLCIYKYLFNLLSHDAHTNYAYSMQNMQ